MSTIPIGKPKAAPDTPAHVPGVRQGNEPGGYEKQVGHFPDGRSDSRRSTGVESRRRNPISPDMPNLSPP